MDKADSVNRSAGTEVMKVPGVPGRLAVPLPGRALSRLECIRRSPSTVPSATAPEGSSADGESAGHGSARVKYPLTRPQVVRSCKT